MVILGSKLQALTHSGRKTFVPLLACSDVLGVGLALDALENVVLLASQSTPLLRTIAKRAKEVTLPIG